MVKKTATALTLAICLSSQAIALNFTDLPSSHYYYYYEVGLKHDFDNLYLNSGLCT